MNRDLETLSAFLDGETSELETRRVMRDIDDSELDTLARWQLAKATATGVVNTKLRTPPCCKRRHVVNANML